MCVVVWQIMKINYYREWLYITHCLELNTNHPYLMHIFSVPLHHSWSFGVLLWEIFTLGSSPFPMVDPASISTLIRSGVRNPKPKLAPTDVYALMCACWEWDSRKRPAFSELRQWLESFERNLRPQRDNLIYSNLPTPTSSLSIFCRNGRFEEPRTLLQSGTSGIRSSLGSSTSTHYAEIKTA